MLERNKLDLGELLTWWLLACEYVGEKYICVQFRQIEKCPRHPHSQQYNLTLQYSFAFLIALREKRTTVVAQLKQLQAETEPIVKMFEDPETTRQMQSTRQLLSFLKKYFIEVALVYNVVLISAVQQSNSVLRVYRLCVLQHGFFTGY